MDPFDDGTFLPCHSWWIGISRSAHRRTERAFDGLDGRTSDGKYQLRPTWGRARHPGLRTLDSGNPGASLTPSWH